MSGGGMNFTVRALSLAGVAIVSSVGLGCTPSVEGKLKKPDGSGAGGIGISVSDSVGVEVARTVTASDGSFRAKLPGRGFYVVDPITRSDSTRAGRFEQC